LRRRRAIERVVRCASTGRLAVSTVDSHERRPMPSQRDVETGAGRPRRRTGERGNASWRSNDFDGRAATRRNLRVALPSVLSLTPLGHSHLCVFPLLRLAFFLCQVQEAPEARSLRNRLGRLRVRRRPRRGAERNAAPPCCGEAAACHALSSSSATGGALEQAVRERTRARVAPRARTALALRRAHVAPAGGSAARDGAGVSTGETRRSCGRAPPPVAPSPPAKLAHARQPPPAARAGGRRRMAGERIASAVRPAWCTADCGPFSS
jgi:hypothetical protein